MILLWFDIIFVLEVFYMHYIYMVKRLLLNLLSQLCIL